MLLEPHAGTIAWTIITFLIVLFVLKGTVWKPLLQALDQREAGIKEALEGAERVRAQAQTMLEEQAQHAAQAEAEARETVRQAREAAQRAGQEIIEAARKEAQQAVIQARLRIESEKRTAIAELRREVAELAVQAAGAVINANLDNERNRRLVDELIAGVPGPPEK
ncbi:MAG: F0F1 ATP synthase subunit B [Candidatus Latescibacterota bacterium]|jgi:F-type H+-transporting ATPase subunit b